MEHTRRLNPAAAWLVIAATSLLAACAAVTPYDVAHPSQGPLYRLSPDGTQEALPDTLERRADPYVVRLELDPARPKADDHVRIAFVLEDRSSSPAQPVPGAKLACKAGMPNVPGHIHNLGIHAEHPETAPGRYEMAPMRFGMGGRWDLVFQAILENGRQFYGVFPIQVEGPPWPAPPRPYPGGKPWKEERHQH